jgi:hypothetical protein
LISFNPPITTICYCRAIYFPHNFPFEGKVVNQLDATQMEFYSVFLAQRVSGINMPIIRSTIWRTTAFDVQHWYCRLLAACTVRQLFDSVEQLPYSAHASSPANNNCRTVHTLAAQLTTTDVQCTQLAAQLTTTAVQCTQLAAQLTTTNVQCTQLAAQLTTTDVQCTR